MAIGDQMSSESSEVREMAARIVCDYLTGPWKKVTSNNIVLQRVSGGLSNWLYRIQLPQSFRTQVEETGEPIQVLLRLHGQMSCENAFERLITESVIFTLLSERALGPKLHGVFPGGRIEEYIPARPLKTKELSNPKICKTIAEKMAQIHSMNVPISKEPRWIFDTAEKWLKKIKQDLEEFEGLDRETEEYISKFKSYDLDSELCWLRKFLRKLNSPVVFSHNDMQGGNILVHEPYEVSSNEEPSLVLIDFEYCSYNYRGFDLANHFCEYTFDYTVDEYPNFSVDTSLYPSIEQQLIFIRQYLNTLKKPSLDFKTDDSGKTPPILSVQNLNINQRLLPTAQTNNMYICDNQRHNSSGKLSISLNVNEVELDILREIECFTLASHFLWGVWAALQTQSQIPFGYWEYCMMRLEQYFDLKNQLLSTESVLRKRKATDVE